MASRSSRQNEATKQTPGRFWELSILSAHCICPVHSLPCQQQWWGQPITDLHQTIKHYNILTENLFLCPFIKGVLIGCAYFQELHSFSLLTFYIHFKWYQPSSWSIWEHSQLSGHDSRCQTQMGAARKKKKTGRTYTEIQKNVLVNPSAWSDEHCSS